MSVGPAELNGQVVRARGRQASTAAGSLSSRLMTADAGRQIAEMEGLLRAAGNDTGRMEALAALRRWQFDLRLDRATRQKANALVWEFQPNGWDEV